MFMGAPSNIYIDGQQIAWKGFFRLIIFGTAGFETVLLPNRITDAGLNYLRDLLDGTILSSDTAIKYVAMGSSNTPPADGDTKLGNEIFRKVVTKQELPGVGQLKTICYIAPYEACQQIEEIGVFAGPDAASTKDSGVLIARVLYSRLKTNLESWQVERTDSWMRV